MGKARDEVLGCLCVLLCHHTLVFDRSLAVLLAFLLVTALACDWAENRRRRQDLVEVLELLASALLVAIRNGAIVDFLHVGEAVDDECAEKDGVADLVTLNRQAHQIGEGLQLRDLDKAVDIVVLEEETLQFLEPLQLGNIARAYDVIEAHVLERDLFDRLLEIKVIEHFKCIAVDEQLVVTFDFCVTTLHEALRARFLAAFVAVEAKALYALHLVLPLLADDLKEALGAYVLLLVVLLAVIGRHACSATRLGRLSDATYCIHVRIII